MLLTNTYNSSLVRTELSAVSTSLDGADYLAIPTRNVILNCTEKPFVFLLYLFKPQFPMVTNTPNLRTLNISHN